MSPLVLRREPIETAVPDKLEAAARRFWAQVDRDAPGYCWTWKGPATETNLGARRYNVARIAWELSGRGSLERMVLVRTCGTERCVRPEHHEAHQHQTSRHAGRPPVGVLASAEASMGRRTPAPAASQDSAPPSPNEMLRGPDTERMTFVLRPGVLVRTFPGGTTVITPRGEFHDPDGRRAVAKAMAAEGRVAA